MRNTLAFLRDWALTVFAAALPLFGNPITWLLLGLYVLKCCTLNY